MNREISRLIKRMALGRPIESYPVTVTSTVVEGARVQFCTNLERDPVQRKHRKGAFFEASELATLRALFPKGGTFVDIGAHSGNHSLYAALFMHADKVIPIEPHPPAYRLLIQNMLVNGVADRVDFSKLGCAVGEAPAEGCAMKSGRRNPAAARVKRDAKGGDIPMLSADMLLADVTPDMIKIDVSGMEMEVLAGLSGVLNRCAPVLQVEVVAAQDAAFQDWAAQAGYAVAATTKRNKHDLNYILTHKDTAKKKPAQKKPVQKKKPAAKKAATAKTATAKTAEPKKPAPKTSAIKKTTTAARKSATPKKATKPKAAK